MKIYQIHQSGGEWEDSYDYIVGSYLRKSRAEEMKAKFEQQSKIKYEESQQCQNCPIWEQLGNNMEKIAKKCTKYCGRFLRDDYDDGSLDCLNWQSHYEMPEYEIKEVEVEE